MPSSKRAGAKKGGRRHKVKADGTKKRNGVARKTKTKSRTQKRRKNPVVRRRRNYKKKATSPVPDAVPAPQE